MQSNPMVSHEDLELRIMAFQGKSSPNIGFPPAEQIMEQIKAKTTVPSAEYKAAISAALKEKSEPKEQSDLVPAGREYAPRSAKDRRKQLQKANDLKEMKRLQNIISYNVDGTINFLPLNKTFCNDLSGKGGEMCHVIAGELAYKKGYELLTDYNDCDTQVEREKTDFYQIINIFNLGGKKAGETMEAKVRFSEMTGCNSLNFYWTATRLKDENRKLVGDAFLARNIGMHSHCEPRHGGSHPDSNRPVCGRKDMAPSK